MAVNKLAVSNYHGWLILTAAGVDAQLMVNHYKIDIVLSPNSYVKVITRMNGVERTSVKSYDAFKSILKNFKLPFEDLCTYLKITIESDCLISINTSAELELKDE